MIVLYDAERCPYCARVRIALAEKGLEHEVVAVDLSDRPAWLYEKNPLGKVPVLEEDGLVLPESVVIMEYLEERYPEPALLPADPADRSLARLRIFRHDDFTDPYYDVRRGDESARALFEEQVERLDAALDASPWLGGREYGLADIAYVPWVLRAGHLLGVELDPYPALSEWLHRLLERPTVAAEAGIVATL